jgi:hypothetical protein
MRQISFTAEDLQTIAHDRNGISQVLTGSYGNLPDGARDSLADLVAFVQRRRSQNLRRLLGAQLPRSLPGGASVTASFVLPDRTPPSSQCRRLPQRRDAHGAASFPLPPLPVADDAGAGPGGGLRRWFFDRGSPPGRFRISSRISARGFISSPYGLGRRFTCRGSTRSGRCPTRILVNPSSNCSAKAGAAVGLAVANA